MGQSPEHKAHTKLKQSNQHTAFPKGHCEVHHQAAEYIRCIGQSGERHYTNARFDVQMDRSSIQALTLS